MTALSPIMTVAAAAGPPTQVQKVLGPSADASGATTVVLAFPSTVTSGNRVVGAVAWLSNVGTELASVTDDKGNTYNVRVTTEVAADHVCIAMFELSNITNAPKTITASFGALSIQYRRLLLEEWSGVAGVVDGTPAGQIQTAITSGTTNGITSPNTTTTTNGDLIWGVALECKGNQNATAAAGTGYTLGQAGVITDLQYMISEYRTQASAGAIAATFTPAGVTTDWAAQVIAFKLV